MTFADEARQGLQRVQRAGAETKLRVVVVFDHHRIVFSWPCSAFGRILTWVTNFQQATMNKLVVGAALGIALLSTTLQAADPKPATVQPLLTEPLTGIPGKEVMLLTVEYLPGGASLPHRHDADVFVYVLEGALTMQVDGKEPVTVRKGETFRERPNDIHRQSSNASKTEPARFIVFMVKDQGKPTTRPLEGG